MSHDELNQLGCALILLVPFVGTYVRTRSWTMALLALAMYDFPPLVMALFLAFVYPPIQTGYAILSLWALITAVWTLLNVIVPAVPPYDRL